MMAVAVRQDKINHPTPQLELVITRPKISLPWLLRYLWRQTKSYGTIMGILLLLASSLVVLWLQTFYKKGLGVRG